MKKGIQKVLSFALAGAMIIQPLPYAQSVIKVNGGVASEAEFNIPAADANGRVGALMPYTRYDSTAAQLGGSAVLKESKDWAKDNIATQASEQSYVALPNSGAYAEWTMNTTGDGVTMRFTLPDSSDGMGVNGSVDVYVNGKKEQTVNLTSYYMWQYFPGGSPSDTPGGTAAFAFDEVHFKLNKSLNPGDKIRIQSTGAGGYEYGVDFLEIEDVPEAIDQPGNSVSVTDYGATPDDGSDDLDAFVRAVNDADAKGMDLYIPEGTFHLSSMWNIYCSNMKITGAGIWYTNLQFTSDKAFGGGISGGNGSNGGADGYCKNLEFCNVYINSNLRSRYGENAVYKCFMDIFADESVIHDIWEEHFECGFWFGDYNGAMDYCDGVKVINSRIRNNLADGVNFCQGTSNATVYNCSIRNNGDDGLAMWNNHYMNAKDESKNVFAYNTIDLGWRAGLIAIYGGSGHKIYNNYLCDSFMASGIHLNTTFSGYTFSNNTGITFDNNILVRCGTNSDGWNEDLSAVDIKQSVKNVTFNNTQIYDSPFTAIRLLNDGFSGITFNNTGIYGAGLSGQDITFSCNAHSGVAIRESASSPVVFNKLTIANIAPDKYASSAGQKNTTWPFWTDRQEPANLANNNTVNIIQDEITYDVPNYPTADTSQGGGIKNPLDGITGYDVEVAALSWKNEANSSTLKKGDKVTFTAAIRNTSNVDIPEGVSIGVKFTVDDKGSYTNTSYKGGLKAGQAVKISATAKWTATAGGHKITAIADYQDKLPNELSESNNTRKKSINVEDTGKDTSYTKVTGGADLVVTDITWGTETIATGQNMVFTATVVNAGDQKINAGTTIGVQFQVDGNTSVITWCDSYSNGLEPGQSVDLTANGGTSGNSWNATDGTHTVTAWVDDVNRIAEADESNNKKDITITVPYGGIVYVENPDYPDDLDNLGEVVIPTETTKQEETTTEKITEKETETTEKIPETTAKEPETTQEETTKSSELKPQAGDAILSELIGTYSWGTDYKWQKQVTASGISNNMKYLVVKYTGDILSMRLGDNNNPPQKVMWFDTENEGDAVNKAFAVVSGGKFEDTTQTKTVVIGLDESSVSPSFFQSFHVHTGATGSAGSVTIENAWLTSNLPSIEIEKPVETTKEQGAETPTESTTEKIVPPVPFGMVLSCPTDNQIRVVWGRGEVDSYNVYIDGTLVANAVACATYDYSGYAAGTHTVEIATVLSGVESEKISGTVEVIETKPVEPETIISENVLIQGYQMSGKFNGVEGDMGIRIVYSVEPEIDGKNVEKAGIICGVVYGDNPITDKDLVLNSTNQFVAAFETTDKGLIGDVIGDSATAKNYVRTISLSGYNAEGLTAKYYTRAYTVLEDGTIAYGKVESFNIYDVAKYIYQNKSMVDETAHNNLYNKILKVVNPNELPIDYNWSKDVVKPEEVK